MIRVIGVMFLMGLSCSLAYSQCGLLRQQFSINFNTDKDCAPVTVTDYTIRFYFNAPQTPADISITFEWNDIGNNSDVYTIGSGVSSFNGNTEFEATGVFTYTTNEECSVFPVAYISVAGDECETSRKEQLVSSWSIENDFGGSVSIDPGVYQVCFDNDITNATFTDNSEFNCNRNDEPDNPNELDRHTQFVYGTSFASPNRIRDLTLVDGGTVNLTDGSGSPVSTESRGTGTPVTAIHFGPIVTIPAPALGPDMTSFPISAPANPANIVGSEFEITIFNWNICNPWNGSTANPNYNEAVTTTAYIRIVDPPVPDFLTRLINSSGNIQTVFCLDDDIFFDNETTPLGGNNYTWEFFGDNTDLNPPVSTSTQTNPTFSYGDPGDKLIRLTATNPNTNGNCDVEIEHTITISDDALASIAVHDEFFTGLTPAEFCQTDGSLGFTVGLADSTSNIQPQTEWRWEFYDENGAVQGVRPATGYGSQLTDTTKSYSVPGIYPIKLYARNNVSFCESEDSIAVIVYSSPEADFSFSAVCEGERTPFHSIADSVNSLLPRINDDFVDTYEWDFSYDGVTFNPELTVNNSNDFSRYLDGADGVTEPLSSTAGTYTVALRMTTNKGTCSDIFLLDVIVHPLPELGLSSNYSAPVCPGDTIRFFNDSLTTSTTYLLIVNDGTNADTATFNQSDTTLVLPNTGNLSVTYDVWLFAETSNGCQSQTAPVTVEVLPGAPSGFDDLNYITNGSNCSVWESILQVDEATALLDADSYSWTISDEDGILSGFPVTKNSGDPDFHQLAYSLENTSSTNRLYTVHLEVTKGTICIEDSERTFLINPAPGSAFVVAEADSCEYKILHLEATNKGLSYAWQFDPFPDQWVNENDRQNLLYYRPASDTTDLSVTLSLVTTNLANCSSEETDTLVFIEKSEPQLIAEFEVSQDTLVLPENVAAFTNTSTEGSGWTYLWDFGDETGSEERNPGTHEYATYGNYQVSLTVSNSFCRETFSRTVVVMPGQPVLDFAADNTTGCVPFTVAFVNTSQYTEPGTYLWDFGDGTTSTLENPVHVYRRSGKYTVSLYAENIQGIGASLVREDYVEVLPIPFANFIANPTTVFLPDQTVYFRNLSRDATRYQWDFGDGATSDEREPVHEYSEVGNYPITLIVSNELGCSDTLTVEAAIQAITGGEARTPNAFSPSPDGPTGGQVVSGGAGSIMNDVFIPKVDGVTEFRMLIYSRWGQLLFESNSQTIGWDGYYNGKLMPADVYVYRLELTFSDGLRAVRIGDLTLVR